MLPFSCPIALAVFVAGIGAIVDPNLLHPVIQFWPPPFDITRAGIFFCSPWFLICGIPAAMGCVAIVRSTLPSSEKAVVVWWWLNVTWFLTACDMLSGLFQVMPNLTELYKILNKDHHLPPFHPDRAVMDTIYCCEICTLPLILFTIHLYFRGDPIRYVYDAVLAGMQVCGAVAYYIPDIILGEHTSVITNVDRGIAFSWIIMSVAIFNRAVNHVRALAQNNGEAERMKHDGSNRKIE